IKGGELKEDEMDTLIGTVKGPGESSHEYCFITTDNHLSKVGEFVYYPVLLDGEVCPILGKITERKLVRSLPDAFMADPQIAPKDVAALLGAEFGEAELFEVTV